MSRSAARGEGSDLVVTCAACGGDADERWAIIEQWTWWWSDGCGTLMPFCLSVPCGSSAIGSSSTAQLAERFVCRMLPAPMLLRPGPIPAGTGWSFEVKWDGFRALVSTLDGLRVRSRRGWHMTPLLPEQRSLPAGLVLDGELVAFENGVPHFPHLTRRLLHGDRSIPVTFVAFDVLQADGRDLIRSPHHARRAVLESLALNNGHCMTPDTFDDGHALYQAVCEQGLEGVVAKPSASTYRPGQRGWIKVKNPAYWRRDQEIQALRRSLDRRAA